MQKHPPTNNRLDALMPDQSIEATRHGEIECYLSDLADELPVERFEDYLQDLQECDSPEIRKRVLTVMRCLNKARQLLTAGQ